MSITYFHKSGTTEHTIEEKDECVLLNDTPFPRDATLKDVLATLGYQHGITLVSHIVAQPWQQEWFPEDFLRCPLMDVQVHFLVADPDAKERPHAMYPADLRYA